MFLFELNLKKVLRCEKVIQVFVLWYVISVKCMAKSLPFNSKSVLDIISS